MRAAHALIDATAMEDAPDVAHAVERIRVRLSARLREVGVLLPDDTLDQLVEDVLADAIHVSLEWLESGSVPAV